MASTDCEPVYCRFDEHNLDTLLPFLREVNQNGGQSNNHEPQSDQDEKGQYIFVCDICFAAVDWGGVVNHAKRHKEASKANRSIPAVLGSSTTSMGVCSDERTHIPEDRKANGRLNAQGAGTGTVQSIPVQ